MDAAIVLGVALVIFGPKKLPELGKSLGSGLGNFKKALTDAQEDVSSDKKEKSESKSKASADSDSDSGASDNASAADTKAEKREVSAV